MFFTQIIFTALAIALGFALTSAGRPFIKAISEKKNLSEDNINTLEKTLNYTKAILIAILLLFIWGVKITSLWVLGTSLIGFVGVSLFATWSSLSNITSAAILSISSPFEIGDDVSCMDGGELREGKIEEMTLFYVHLRDPDSTRISIPNNLMLQKSIKVHTQKK